MKLEEERGKRGRRREIVKTRVGKKKVLTKVDRKSKYGGNKENEAIDPDISLGTGRYLGERICMECRTRERRG